MKMLIIVFVTLAEGLIVCFHLYETGTQEEHSRLIASHIIAFCLTDQCMKLDLQFVNSSTIVAYNIRVMCHLY